MDDDASPPDDPVSATPPSPPRAGPGVDREGAGSGRESVRAVDTPDGRLRLRVAGSGPALLCLHGLSAHGGIWDPLASLLSDRFTLYVPDLLGRGASEPRPDAPYTLERERARLGAVLGAMGGDAADYVAVGHSQGAALAVALAAGPLPRPRGLVLVCPVSPWTSRPASLALLRSAVLRRAVAPLLVHCRRPLCRWVLEHRAFGDPDLVDDAAVERYAAPYADPERARTLLRSLADWRPGDLADHVPRRPPPAAVVAGSRDDRIPPEDARRWARALGGHLEIVERAGHALPEECPAAVARAVERIARGGRPDPS